MNFPFFVAQRIQTPQKSTFSATVARVGVITIAIGIATGIIAIAVLLGFKNTISQKVFLFGSHLQVVKLSLNQSFEEPPIALHTFIYDNWKNIQGIRHCQAVAHKPGILKTPNELQGIILKGVGKDYDWQLFQQNMVAGRPIQFADTTAVNEVIVSSLIARKMELKVGSDVLLYLVQNPPRVRKLKVVGIYETNLEEFDNQLILGDIALVQKLNGWSKDSVGKLEYFVKDFNQLEATAQNLYKYLPTDLRLERVTQRFGAVFDWLKLLDKNTAVLLILVFFVTCFNIASVLLVMMMERTYMVGLLKTLGSPNTQIRRIFFYVGLRLALKGLVIGNLLGLGICWLQYKFKVVPLDPVNYFMNIVPIEFDWLSFLWLNVGVIVLIAAILTIPTLIIGRIKPVQALIFKK